MAKLSKEIEQLFQLSFALYFSRIEVELDLIVCKKMANQKQVAYVDKEQAPEFFDFKYRYCSLRQSNNIAINLVFIYVLAPSYKIKDLLPVIEVCPKDINISKTAVPFKLFLIMLPIHIYCDLADYSAT